MSSLLSQFLYRLTAGGEVHDYAHAAQVFRTNDFSRSPRYKYLFYVNFVLSADVPNYISAREIGYLVKSVELPKFTIDVKDLNQYNRHVYIQDRIKYEPVTIKFHDDNNNGLRELWQNYYNYYYADGQYGIGDYNYDDRYQDRLHSSWGLDNGSLTPFFSAIEIYSMFGGESNKITLMSPVITSFIHDTHEHAESQGIMEASMQVRYNGVTYEDGYVEGIPGFSNGAYYDDTLSGISGHLVGSFVDAITGNPVRQPSTFINPVQARQADFGNYQFQNQGFLYSPSTNNSLTNQELDNIIKNNQYLQQNGDTVFPTAEIIPPSYSQNPMDLQIVTNPESATGYVNLDKSVITNQNPYSEGTYQYTLFNQGYNITQINSATQFVTSVPDSIINSYNYNNPITTQTILAQQYIDNPQSLESIGTVSFGQNTIPTSIDFTSPSSSVSPVYNSQSWQQTLLSQGYTESDIALASNQINKLNIAPGTNVASIAVNYINFSKNQTA